MSSGILSEKLNTILLNGKGTHPSLHPTLTVNLVNEKESVCKMFRLVDGAHFILEVFA